MTQLWKKLTSTVGLVTVPDGDGLNVMSAEWSYFVNKEPLYVAVVLGPRAVSHVLLATAGRFAVTFCGEHQADLADFAGSFTARDLDKTSSQGLAFGEPTPDGVPWVTGGVLAVECVLRQVVPMPVHRMYIGEVVAAHEPDQPVHPLVKHGGMFTLGPPAARRAVIAAAAITPRGALRVGATAPPSTHGAGWRVTLNRPDGTNVDLGEHHASGHGDLLTDIALPRHLTAADVVGSSVTVARGEAATGTARVSGPGPRR
ncbi:flavin reductase family protein [Pilimelia columellifera]|uniref:Flavin reductase like domain-containing protein n=1 Tax=Pilimelia columellifera subsp. columellifera TaxID=706583 RepID=A0ABP6A659_9ACTN